MASLGTEWQDHFPDPPIDPSVSQPRRAGKTFAATSARLSPVSRVEAGIKWRLWRYRNPTVTRWKADFGDGLIAIITMIEHMTMSGTAYQWGVLWEDQSVQSGIAESFRDAAEAVAAEVLTILGDDAES